MRFAIKTSPENTTWDDVLAIWRHADDGDLYETAWNFDHFYPVYADPSKPCLEAWTTLSALAQATSRIRIGTLVNGIVYRHPAVIANMAATLDVISGGRLELGLGSGWHEAECDAYGIELGTLTQRFDRLEEALEIIIGLLRDETTDFAGEHYTVTAARCEPKPVQRPHPPICIGGVGRKRTMPIVARYAQHWNHPAASPDELRELLDVLDRLCADIGRDRAEILISSHVYVMPGRAPGEVAEQIAELEGAGLEMAIVYLQPPYDLSVLDPLVDALAPLAT